MTPVLVSVEELPRELERRLRVVIATGDVDAAVAPVLPGVAAVYDEIPADFRPAALVVPSKIQALAFAGRDNDVAQKLHVCEAALIAEIAGVRLDELLRVRGGHASNDCLARRCRRRKSARGYCCLSAAEAAAF